MSITLLDMLKNAGMITSEQFNEALQHRVIYGGKIGTSLIELGFINEDELARFLSNKLEVPRVNAEQLLRIPPSVISLIPREIALKYLVVPIHRDGKKLYVVMADPSALTAIDEIAFATGFAIRPLIAPEVRLMQALSKYYNLTIDSRYLQIIKKIESRKKSSLPPPREVMGAHADVAPPSAAVWEKVQKIRESEESAAARSADVGNGEKVSWPGKFEEYSIDSVSQALARASDREEIASIIMDYVASRFTRVALFLVREGTAFGWLAIHENRKITDIDKLYIPLSGASVLKTVTDGSGFYLGPVADTPLNVKLLEGLGAAPSSILLMPLVINGRIVCILYVEDKEKELADYCGELHKLLLKAALAFEILIFRERILMI